MSASRHQESARIYDFPKRGRAPVGSDRQDVVRTGATNVAALRLPKVVVTSGWYHEAAIQEAERAAVAR